MGGGISDGDAGYSNASAASAAGDGTQPTSATVTAAAPFPTPSLQQRLDLNFLRRWELLSNDNNDIAIKHM